MDIIKMLEQEQINNEVIDFNVGDTVQVHYRIKEGNRERIQSLKELYLKDKVED